MTEQPPTDKQHDPPLNDEDEIPRIVHTEDDAARLQSHRLLREKRLAVNLWRGLLDCMDCGDCIEDFQRQPGIQFKISHLTTILMGWLKEAEDNVEDHGKSDMERIRLMLESDLNE